MQTYTALLALPDGTMANDAAARLPNASVVNDVEAGVWVTWHVEAETDKEGVLALQEIRLRAEMFPEFVDGSATDRTLFQTTPFIVLRGAAAIIHSEEVLCI